MLYLYYSNGYIKFIKETNSMARIDISEPYEKYLTRLVESGLFRSITAAAEAAIRKQMEEDENMRTSSIAIALAKGEADIRAGRTISYSPALMGEITQKGKQAAIDKKSVKPDVRE